MRYFHGLFEFKLFSLIYIASDSIKFWTLSVLNIVNGIFLKTWTGWVHANVELIMVSSLDFPICSQKIIITNFEFCQSCWFKKENHISIENVYYAQNIQYDGIWEISG